MTYEQIKGMMPDNRRWCKWGSCLYLQKYRNAIRIRYGYIYRRSQVMAVWYPDGRFKFMSLCYYYSHRSKVNYFMPNGYEVCSHRYYSFLWCPNEERDKSRLFYTRSTSVHVPDSFKNKWVWITKNGVKGIGGITLKEIRDKLRKDDINRDIPRRRGRYWRRKMIGVYRKPCGKTYFQGCKWHKAWPRPLTNWEGECGCKVYTKKAVSRDTVESIMKEHNATVRTAKIQIYGIERFFIDAETRTINKEAGYELLELNTGPAHQDESNRWGMREQNANVVLTALRMNCSTTGKVYVNTVPSQLRTVRAALDWMYDTDSYLEKVGKQT